MVNISQGAVAAGVLTLLFGGDLYSMIAGQAVEVNSTVVGHTVDQALCARSNILCVLQGPSNVRTDLAAMSDSGRLVVAYCTS